jgi:hypothetical protein
MTQFPESRTHLVTARVANVPSSIQTISIAVALLGSIASAPVQCGRDPDPETSMEEGPGEAIYGLAEQFREQGNVEAQKSTLTYIVKRFPSSRFAKRAKQDLEALGVKADPASAP